MKRNLITPVIQSRRGGAVIIVVISLMTTLVFLGLFFWSWTSQEVANAEVFADPASNLPTVVNPNALFDMAAEQLIVGTRNEFGNSALWGGVHSMLAHQIGKINPDLTPVRTNVGTGRGIVMEFTDSNNNGVFDYDSEEIRFRYTNADDLSSPGDVLEADELVLNYSPLSGVTLDPKFGPNVDYTYPDINNLFLAHEEVTTVTNGGGSENYRVIIPSFFRPQLFSGYREAQSFATLYDDNHGGKILRPHKLHRYSDNSERYLTADMTTAPQSGNMERRLKQFPFPATGRFGVFTGVSDPALANDYTFLDVDLDNDGVNDSIWIDLDLPMLNLPGGYQYVPMASFKILDADGLLNLNAHGNIQGSEALGRNEHSDEPVSVSNLGMSRSEVNPLWALTGQLTGKSPAEVALALRNVQDRFPAVSSPSQMQLANLELYMLLSGWEPEGVSLQTVLGRYGEKDVVDQFGGARAGRTGVDDDEDNGRFGIASTDNSLSGLSIPGYIHPLSPVGLGLRGFGDASVASYLQSGGSRRLQSLSATPTPVQWPMYGNFRRSVRYLPELQDGAAPVSDLLVDEDDETILDPSNLNYGVYDSPFAASENGALQLSESDWQKLGIMSRVRTLAAANFEHANNAEEIRRRFSTDSWDRLEFNYAVPPGRSWELGGPNPEWGGDGSFPPWISGATVQPFRAEIRDLFRTEFDANHPLGISRVSPRHRLNLNGILSDDRAHGGEAAFVDGSPRYRNLVPHPAPEPRAPLTGNSSLLDNPNFHAPLITPSISSITGDQCAQEWWARYDRQRLARDLYCLLWVLGNGNDNGTPPDAVQAREMAQFAVNVVDALDRDNVITRFEYDPHLEDGWDTNPANLQVVYGIEEQQLVFSEWLLIETASEDEDSPRTLHDDRGHNDEGHRFLYLELRNTSAEDLKLDEQWRIVRVSDGGMAGSEVIDIAVEFRTSNGSSKVVPPGGIFTIACHDGAVKNGNGDVVGSTLYVNVSDDTDGGPLQAIVPIATGSGGQIVSNTLVPEPLLDLDLTPPDSHAHRGFREFTNKSAAYVGATLVEQLEGNVAGPEFKLLLQRRKNLHATVPSDTEWIEVDRIEIDPAGFGTTSPFTTGSNPNQSHLEAQVGARKSQERPHPFADKFETNDSSELRKHSLRSHDHPEKNFANYAWRKDHTDEPFPHWQPHFNRDFSSVMELLSIPLYGNRGGTESSFPVAYDSTTFRNAGTVPNLVDNDDRMSGIRTAQVRFLNPGPDLDEYPPTHPWREDLATIPHYRNRWYRLLEFVEVKSRDQLRMDAITAVQRRTPGKVNLNTIRDESVLAGLVDDPHCIDPRNKMSATTEGLDGRKWYDEFRRARDGVDPLMEDAGLSGIHIPGALTSKPFRAFSVLEESAAGNRDGGAASTVLRVRPGDPGEGLFQLAEVDADGIALDHHTRNRILAKIANNTTTRSHVFFVWMGLDFFEAHRKVNGQVQIGSRSEDLPRYRMFCVVDMSRLEEAYNPINGTFDFRKFIIHRQLLP